MTSATWADASGWTARVGGASLLGNYRASNEDFLHLDPTLPLALVLDAFQLADVFCPPIVRASQDQLRPGAPGDPVTRLRAAFRAANAAVVALNANTDLRGLGATAVCAWFEAGRVFTPWLGNSTAYRVSRGRIERLTWPHDFRHWLIRSGRMTESEAASHRIRNVLFHYLGSWDAGNELEIPSFVPSPGDRLVLATDGLWGVLIDAELSELCQTHPDPQACAEELVQLALLTGSRDNVTVVVIAFEGCARPALPEPPAPCRPWWRLWR